MNSNEFNNTFCSFYEQINKFEFSSSRNMWFCEDRLCGFVNIREFDVFAPI